MKKLIILSFGLFLTLACTKKENGVQPYEPANPVNGNFFKYQLGNDWTIIQAGETHSLDICPPDPSMTSTDNKIITDFSLSQKLNQRLIKTVGFKLIGTNPSINIGVKSFSQNTTENGIELYVIESATLGYSYTGTLAVAQKSTNFFKFTTIEKYNDKYSQVSGEFDAVLGNSQKIKGNFRLIVPIESITKN